MKAFVIDAPGKTSFADVPEPSHGRRRRAASRSHGRLLRHRLEHVSRRESARQLSAHSRPRAGLHDRGDRLRRASGKIPYRPGCARAPVQSLRPVQRLSPTAVQLLPRQRNARRAARRRHDGVDRRALGDDLHVGQTLAARDGTRRAAHGGLPRGAPRPGDSRRYRGSVRLRRDRDRRHRRGRQLWRDGDRHRRRRRQAGIGSQGRRRPHHQFGIERFARRAAKTHRGPRAGTC